MYYVDDKGKVLDIQTPLTEALNAVIEDYFDMLSKMTAEQRLNYFKYEQFVEPLRYTQDIDNTPMLCERTSIRTLTKQS